MERISLELSELSRVRAAWGSSLAIGCETDTPTSTQTSPRSKMACCRLKEGTADNYEAHIAMDAWQKLLARNCWVSTRPRCDATCHRYQMKHHQGHIANSSAFPEYA